MFRRVASSFLVSSRTRSPEAASATRTATAEVVNAGLRPRFFLASDANTTSYRLRFDSAPSVANSAPFCTTAALSRSFSTASTPISTSPLDEFRDTVPRQQRMNEPVGRPWSVKELRRKSYDDLHKLWYVLYKERNMLLTELQLGRRRGIIFPQPERMKKVQKSMGAIRQVLGERKREKIAAFKLQRQEEQQLQQKSEDEQAMNFHE